jgi:TonB-dependent SusC/RagA subfamily outer membrane receptor
VNVILEGTVDGMTIVALTNASGNYTIEIPSANGRLIFSSPGYVTQAVPIEGRNVIDMVLQSGVEAARGFATPNPAANPGLQIRNLGSPLFVIDGVFASEVEFNRLLPAQIKNISILKDASAAVYGPQAYNGVVLVITKRDP